MEAARDCNTPLQELEVKAGRKAIELGVEEAELLVNMFLRLSKRALLPDVSSVAEFIPRQQSE